MIPGFDDPAMASHPAGGNLYFEQDQAVALKSPGEVTTGGYATAFGTTGEASNLQLAPLMFGDGAIDGQGQAIVDVSNASRGHISEILNFHGSPAPWILIGILIVAGLLHFSAKASGGVRL